MQKPFSKNEMSIKYNRDLLQSEIISCVSFSIFIDRIFGHKVAREGVIIFFGSQLKQVTTLTP